MANTYSIRDKVAVVTGGSQSIGLTIAKALVTRGAKVVIGDLVDTGAVETLNEMAGGPAAAFVKCDVTDPAALRALIDHAVSHFGRLDILVNNAGILDKPLEADPTGAHNRLCVDINLRAVIDGTGYALGIWERDADAQGVVVSMASIAGYYPTTMPVYSATKAAVSMYTKSLGHLAPKVRVNAVAPTWVDTKLIDAEHIGRDHPTVKFLGLLEPQTIADHVVRMIEDESMAGDVLIVENGKEPRLCTIPNSRDVLKSLAEGLSAA
ncbi:hypothetical protein IWQ56_007305 [Coemansia nantahalensis]|nr:hypothetical protein IWQ56_007305 [Coemansia nantahalensis]